MQLTPPSPVSVYETEMYKVNNLTVYTWYEKRIYHCGSCGGANNSLLE